VLEAGFSTLFISVRFNRVESGKKVVHFIGLFEKGDDENKLTAEKNNFFIKKNCKFCWILHPVLLLLQLVMFDPGACKTIKANGINTSNLEAERAIKNGREGQAKVRKAGGRLKGRFSMSNDLYDGGFLMAAKQPQQPLCFLLYLLFFLLAFIIKEMGSFFRGFIL